MAPQSKTKSSSVFVYKLNNFHSLCEHNRRTSRVLQPNEVLRSNATCLMPLTEAPILFSEVIEEVWTTAVYNITYKVITFNLKGNLYSINGDVLNTFLNLPANTHVKSPTRT